ncbi:hypothetical protein JOB18_033066 [Solea senegalensis]|uniref:Uncharacterized protein n=1 Tax=Solea senegalensis TaxID=28829 RepID=A0AAV6QDT0_SOLSE|nr:hypothetical protein JOB18_033066 [Solea senegalensis]
MLRKDRRKPRTTNGKLAIRGMLSMGCHGSTIHRQRGSWMQGLPRVQSEASVNSHGKKLSAGSARASHGAERLLKWRVKDAGGGRGTAGDVKDSSVWSRENE